MNENSHPQAREVKIMSEEKVFDLYKQYAQAKIEEAKARAARDNSQEYKIHYEMVELRNEISRALENVVK